MLNSNDYDRGYKEGLKQAREGKKKNFFNFNKLKVFFSSHALDTYIDGVNQGYLDGMRDKHILNKNKFCIDETQNNKIKEQYPTQQPYKEFTPTISSGGNNMNPIFENQIDTLRNLKAFLLQFIDNLQISEERYQKFLDDLSEQQLDMNIYERYQAEFLDETKKSIHSIINNIESGDIPYIERIIQHIEELPIG